MSITGNLKTMELAELLQWLSQGRKSGTLHINNGRVEKRIFFEEGTIVSSAASDPKEYLGHFLVSHGFIDELTLAKAMEMQEENKMLLGKILLTIGAISETDLDRMLRLKAEESIYQIFTWTEGEFRFADGDLPDYHMWPLSLSVTAVVLEGHQRVDEWKQIRARIPNSSAVPVATRELRTEQSDPGVDKILALVDDDRTIQEIALQTHSGEFHVCRVLYEQIRAGALKIVRPRQLMAEAPPAPPPQKVNDVTVDVDALLRVAEQHIENREFARAIRHLRAAQNLEPDSKHIKQTVEAAEQRIVIAIRQDGIDMKAVPLLNCDPTSLDSLDISPQQGFILTRVNGTYDIQTILKITPVPPLEAQVLFWKLHQAGHISLESPKS
ncbi:MAG: DUF4388 domain-containing protein [Thermoanaerobaculia bacterium]|jgi:hypothetical protein